MEPGIIVHSGIATSTGSADVNGLPSIEPFNAFNTLESYQPHPISLLSMWPLDPRPDIYSSATHQRLTSSHGAVATAGTRLQIGLTPHRMKEEFGHPAGVAEVNHSVFTYADLYPGAVPVSASGGGSPAGFPSGSLYSALRNVSSSFAQIENLMTGTAGELVYSTKPTMFFHSTGSIEYGGGSSPNLKGYRAQTASLQYNRHTFPYNTPFYATNRVRGRNPFYNSYADFAQDMKLIGRDYSYVPEYKTADNIKYYYERYFKGQLDSPLHNEITLTEDFDPQTALHSFYDSQAAVLGFETPKIIKRKIFFPESKKPKDFKLRS